MTSGTFDISNEVRQGPALPDEIIHQYACKTAVGQGIYMLAPRSYTGSSCELTT